MNAPWLKYLPRILQVNLNGRFEAQNIIGNSSWLFADKLLRMALGLAVGVWMTRYLGAIAFGQFSYALAFVAIFSAIASAGLDGIVVRELVRNPAMANEILGSAFFLKLIAGTLALALTLIAITLINTTDQITFYLVAIISGSLIFQAFDVIDFWFQAQVQSRFIVIARMAAFMFTSFIRVVLIVSKGSLIAFAAVSLAEIVLGALCIIFAYLIHGHRISEFQARSKMARHLLRESWPLLLSGMAVVLYMRVDVLMLQEMVGTQAVGIYAAATRLSEVWYTLPVILVASASPAILRSSGTDATAFLIKLQKLYFLLVWLAIGIAFPLSLGANYLVTTLYGPGFAAAGPVLAIHLWASVAVFLGVASSQYLLAENLQHIAFYRTAIGLICNVALNLILIPRYNAAGAALATVVSYFIATFSLVCFKTTRKHSIALFTAPFARNLTLPKKS